MKHGEETKEKDIDTLGTDVYNAQYEPGQDLVCANLIFSIIWVPTLSMCEPFVI